MKKTYLLNLFISLIALSVVNCSSHKAIRMSESYHPFKSEKAKEKYLTYYDQQAKSWPVSSENRYIKTSFGETYVRISGATDKPPLVLLHGDTENSLSWVMQVEEFSKYLRTYAIDHVYDNGRSIYSKHFEEPGDYTNYLIELFDSLGLKDSINLLGFSYGGWQASLLAHSNPDRLNKVILISPAATVLSVKKQYVLRAILAHSFPGNYFKRSQIYWERDGLMNQGQKGQAIVDRMVYELILARECFKKRNTVIPTVLTDQELQNIKVPVLFLVGENEVLYSAQKAVNRVKNIPQVQTEIIPNSSHDATLSQPNIVNRMVLDFLLQN